MNAAWSLKSLIQKIQVPIPTQISAEVTEMYGEVGEAVTLSLTCVLSKLISFKDFFFFFLDSCLEHLD